MCANIVSQRHGMQKGGREHALAQVCIHTCVSRLRVLADFTEYSYALGALLCTYFVHMCPWLPA